MKKTCMILKNFPIVIVVATVLLSSCANSSNELSNESSIPAQSTSVTTSPPVETEPTFPPYSRDCGAFSDNPCYVEVGAVGASKIYFELQNIALLCVYYQEFEGSPNQKQMKILREAEESIALTASTLDGDAQEVLKHWDYYMLFQLNFWDEYPDADYKPASLTSMKNPCELDSVLLRIKEFGMDIKALEALSI